MISGGNPSNGRNGQEQKVAGVITANEQRKTEAANTPHAGKVPEEAWKAMREAGTAGAIPQSEQRKTGTADTPRAGKRSEEHTSELQSRQYLVCRLLLEKKKTQHS